MINETLWERLNECDPAGVCRRSLVEYDEKKGEYVLPVLNAHYSINPLLKEVIRMESGQGRPGGYHESLATVVYLLTAKDVVAAGDLITAEQMAYGPFFFRGPHALPTQAVEKCFGFDVESFVSSGESLGGRVVKHGDAAVELPALPRVPLTYVLWEGDDEFPPRASILFYRSIEEHLPVDAIWSLTRYVTKELTEFSMKE